MQFNNARELQLAITKTKRNILQGEKLKKKHCKRVDINTVFLAFEVEIWYSLHTI